MGGGGALGALKRQLEPMGSDALGSFDDMEQ